MAVDVAEWLRRVVGSLVAEQAEGVARATGVVCPQCRQSFTFLLDPQHNLGALCSCGFRLVRLEAHDA